MDFDDIPKTITLGESCLEKWDTPQFAESFLDEMRENQNTLHLEVCCKRGGYIEDDYVEYNDFIINGESNGKVNGSFTFSFTESVPTGCKDVEMSCAVSGTMYFALRLSDGDVSLEHTPYLNMSGE